MKQAKLIKCNRTKEQHSFLQGKRKLICAQKMPVIPASGIVNPEKYLVWDIIYINLAAFDHRKTFISKLAIQTYPVYYIWVMNQRCFFLMILGKSFHSDTLFFILFPIYFAQPPLCKQGCYLQQFFDIFRLQSWSQIFGNLKFFIQVSFAAR